eukprot:4424818-Karenia_brevis.AAC.1
MADRGAEQGDPLGPLQCALVLGDVASEARESISSISRDTGGRLLDAWYMDDGQVLCSPSLVDPFLRAPDNKAKEVGATRGQGPDVKRVARLVGPEA